MTETQGTLTETHESMLTIMADSTASLEKLMAEVAADYRATLAEQDSAQIKTHEAMVKASLFHDFRAPMSAVLTGVAFLQLDAEETQAINETITSRLAEIDATTHNILHLIESLQAP
jgi:hypothetical protein